MSVLRRITVRRLSDSRFRFRSYVIGTQEVGRSNIVDCTPESGISGTWRLT